MRKQSRILAPDNANRLTKRLTDMVTGNPIAEDYSPIKKINDPAAALLKPRSKETGPDKSLRRTKKGA